MSSSAVAKSSLATYPRSANRSRTRSMITATRARTPQHVPRRRPRARNAVLAVCIGASYTDAPPEYVASTRVAMMSSGAARIQSRSSTAKSAYFPTEMLPAACSKKHARAAQTVIDASASSRDMRCLGYQPPAGWFASFSPRDRRVERAPRVDDFDRRVGAVRDRHAGVEQRAPRVRAEHAVGPEPRLRPRHVADLMRRLHRRQHAQPRETRERRSRRAPARARCASGDRAPGRAGARPRTRRGPCGCRGRRSRACTPGSRRAARAP